MLVFDCTSFLTKQLQMQLQKHVNVNNIFLAILLPKPTASAETTRSSTRDTCGLNRVHSVVAICRGGGPTQRFLPNCSVISAFHRSARAAPETFVDHSLKIHRHASFSFGVYYTTLFHQRRQFCINRLGRSGSDCFIARPAETTDLHSPSAAELCQTRRTR